jgi:acetylornithine deacetylase
MPTFNIIEKVINYRTNTRPSSPIAFLVQNKPIRLHKNKSSYLPMIAALTESFTETELKLNALELNEERFLQLLAKLIGESEFVQNTGVGTNFVPREDLCVRHVVDVLEPYTIERGGRLTVERKCYAPGRSNVIVRLKGRGESREQLSFVGSHLDVVPADAEAWEVDPFKLTVDGDKLYGRGTTDCLGHVALLTTLFTQLAEMDGYDLRTSLSCVFIASEEANGPGIGVDGLVENGELEHCKAGPVVWVDCADSQPCIGTAGAITWDLSVKGHRFHSGLPHKGINAIELAMEATSKLQEAFYEKFPPCEQEREYKFITSSTMKPTQIRCAPGGLNQIPPDATVSGDIRLTPFYEVDEVKAFLEKQVKDMNENIQELPTRGPWSKYVIDDPSKTSTNEKLIGKIEINWGEHLLTGIACDLSSPAFTKMCDAIKEVKGKAEPYSLTGSLPLVHDLKSAGFDIQLIGFGLMSTYHADNEHALLSDMKDAAKILSKLIMKFH